MTFRSRPVLDRKHRPRWQDELRTQQLTIAAFAVAIALALGIFGAATWNGYWESHVRPVAAVDGTMYDRSDLAERERILTAEAVATVAELQAQLGGPRDQLIQQQIDSLTVQFNSLSTTATASLVESAVLAARAGDYGLAVSEADLEAGIAERLALPERVNANLILVEALPEDAEAEDEPTEEEMAEAVDEAQAALDRIEGGEEFATVAAEVSDDFTAASGGALGWFEGDDPAYDEYFEALSGAEEGELVGPIETERGAVVLELVGRREATADGGLRQLLRDAGIDDASYRDFVRDELLVDEFRAYFSEEVVTSPAPQQRVAQIVIAPVQGTVVPQERGRHVLIAPDPELDDQAEATDEQWEAALDEAREVQALVEADEADWFEIAEERSDDPGSAARGGDLGWYDPATVQFVAEFAAALTALEVGEVSDPVRTQFGYHVIQKTGERESPQAQADELVQELRADPDAFAEVAARESEDHATAIEGGELGWVAPYQLDTMHEEVIFAMSEEGEISEPVDTGTEGIVIYRLLESDEGREIEDERLEQIRRSGFERWMADDVRAPVEIWVDPQFASSAAT